MLKRIANKFREWSRKFVLERSFLFLTQSFPASFELCEFILFLKLFMDKDGFVEEVQQKGIFCTKESREYSKDQNIHFKILHQRESGKEDWRMSVFCDSYGPVEWPILQQLWHPRQFPILASFLGLKTTHQLLRQFTDTKRFVDNFCVNPQI